MAEKLVIANLRQPAEYRETTRRELKERLPVADSNSLEGYITLRQFVGQAGGRTHGREVGFRCVVRGDFQAKGLGGRQKAIAKMVV